MLEALIKTSAAVISHDAVAIHTVHTRPAVQRSREQEQIDRPIHQFIIGTTDQDIMLFLAVKRQFKRVIHLNFFAHMHSDRAGIGNTDRPCSKIVQHRHSAGALEYLHRAGRIRKLLTDLFQVILFGFIIAESDPQANVRIVLCVVFVQHSGSAGSFHFFHCIRAMGITKQITSIIFATFKADTDTHLLDRTTIQRQGRNDFGGLSRHQKMHAVGTSFRNDLLRQICAPLCHLAVCSAVKQNLELIHDDHDTGHAVSGIGNIVFQLCISTGSLEYIRAIRHLLDQIFQDALAELLQCIQRQQLDVRQPLRFIDFELGTALEIHQIQIELFRRIVHHTAHNQRMQQGRFAATRTTADQAMMRSALAKHHAHDRIAIADAHRQLQHLGCAALERFRREDLFKMDALNAQFFDRLVIFYRKFFQLSGIGFFDQTDREMIRQQSKAVFFTFDLDTILFQFGQFFVYVIIAACHLDRSIPAQDDIDAALVSFLHNRGQQFQTASVRIQREIIQHEQCNRFCTSWIVRIIIQQIIIIRAVTDKIKRLSFQLFQTAQQFFCPGHLRDSPFVGIRHFIDEVGQHTDTSAALFRIKDTEAHFGCRALPKEAPDYAICCTLHIIVLRLSSDYLQIEWMMEIKHHRQFHTAHINRVTRCFRAESTHDFFIADAFIKDFGRISDLAHAEQLRESCTCRLLIKWLLRYLFPFSKVLNGNIQLCIIFRFDQLADKRRERNAPVLHSLKDKHILTEEAVETGFIRHRMIKQRQAALRKALLILLDDRC